MPYFFPFAISVSRCAMYNPQTTTNPAPDRVQASGRSAKMIKPKITAQTMLAYLNGASKAA